MQIACAQQEIHHHAQQKSLIKVLSVYDNGSWVLNLSKAKSDCAETIRSDWAESDDSVYF